MSSTGRTQAVAGPRPHGHTSLDAPGAGARPAPRGATGTGACRVRPSPARPRAAATILGEPVPHQKRRTTAVDGPVGAAGAWAHAAPRAGRLRPPDWRDPRFAVGLLLVLVPVGVGAHVVARADRTVPVYAAARTLTTGTVVDLDDLVVRRIRFDGGARLYLGADAAAPQGLVAVRTVPAGELVPRSALGDADGVDLRAVPVPLDGDVPSGLVVGVRVDVWASLPEQARAGGHGPARRLADAVEVHAVRHDDGAWGATTGPRVEVLLPPAELTPVLDALAAEAMVTMVVVPGPA